MSLAGSQQKVFLRLVGSLRPHWRKDANLPARIQAIFASNRSFGSRDRRLYRELIYTTLRYLPWIEPLLESDPNKAAQTVAWLSSDIPATAGFRAAMCADWPPCPASTAGKAGHLNADPLALLPEWFRRHCPEATEPSMLDALQSRAPLWLRLQTAAPARVLDELKARGWNYRRAEIVPGAIQLLADADVKKTEAWQNGELEVQDLGSQLILESVGLEPGAHWLDACAGAGGKTLQLAMLLGPEGKVDAHDIRAEALRELQIRAGRAGLCHLMDDKPDQPRRAERSTLGAQVNVLPGPPDIPYDGVLVDAPCSGSGTWRRSPHLKWTTSASDVTQAAEKQRHLLERFSARVRRGGRLVYATCSLSRFENEDVVASFLEQHPEFAPAPFGQTFGFPPRGHGLTVLPARHDTDGFFVASFRRQD